MAEQTLAFGVDPRRKERYSLRQSRYHALSEDVSRLATKAQKQGRRLSLLDIGVGSGVSRRYLDAQPGTQVIDYYGADLELQEWIYREDDWKQIYLGNLLEGYARIPDDSFDIVICEQVLEHLPDLQVPMETLARVLKPGGTMIVGVPVFPEGVHLLRKHLVPIFDSIHPWPKQRGHVQAFSARSFTRLLQQHADVEISSVRGFRVVSGGLLRPLENQRWWWRLNRRIGAAVPGLCIEIQVIARKPFPATIPISSVRKKLMPASRSVRRAA